MGWLAPVALLGVILRMTLPFWKRLMGGEGCKEEVEEREGMASLLASEGILDRPDSLTIYMLSSNCACQPSSSRKCVPISRERPSRPYIVRDHLAL